MKISYLELDKLVPYEKNAKKHPQEQIEKLAKEIDSVGWTQPIVVDHQMNIVVGHGRRLAALHLGLSKVPVYVLDAGISPARLKAMRLFDNKIQETGFDIDLLNQELFELSEIPDFDIKLTGFQLPQFVPNLPEEDEDTDETQTDFVLRVTLRDEDEQQMLFTELRDRGFKVKV